MADKNSSPTKKFALLAISAALALGFTALAMQKPDATTESAQTESAAPADQPLAVATKDITDAAGRRVSVPVEPKRVLALGEFDMDAMLALGMKPVGVTDGRGQQTPPSYLKDLSAGIESIGRLAQPSIDKVIAAQPDLILTGTIQDEKLISQLQQIAPTVITSATSENWRDMFKRIATALGKESEAESFLVKYNEKAAKLRESLENPENVSVSVVRWSPKGPTYMLRDVFISQVIEDVGLSRPPAQQESGIHSAPLSLEALHEIDGDWIFVGTLSPVGDAADTFAEIRDNAAFKQLSGVNNGHLVLIDGSLWTSVGGPLAAMAALEDIEKAMLGKQG
ncbi:ABC-type Fe3+-hydroxamate transport system, periplasmic component [Hahella chejuensis KCTC 2396]|uniref:ABC-type Fe3+-hydroxamate transport system, periplasmic component n=1 Tax=Hahella chejuensis (strain KCTC 2396) TaxID=349521 RepID=Q2S816_HAHCH|nr:iron-siderophore ABC transporter substrate-binding protein [Hahella chejuensis]ABC33208.1 ABC-type Fe3+-hydroxamate transport system, periplasmic component [Hahella chejuensis KCTC 2396]